MKKSLTIFIFFLIMFSLFVNSTYTIKTDLKVIQQLEKEKKVNVFVELKKETKDLPGKIRHNFGKEISLEITQSDLNKLEKNSNVKEIKLVGIRKLFLEESVPLINTTNVWNSQINNTNLTGLGETVCVLDTGANFSHPDLQGRNKTCVIDCTSGSCVENCSLADFNGHGTHCSGIIAANGNLKGVGPSLGLIALKVCTSASSCLEDDIRAAIDWCIANSNTYNISVISMSLGSNILYDSYCDGIDDSSNITSSINNAVANNISVIVSTGNDGNSTHIASPACIQNATAVGATYDENYSRRPNSGYVFNCGCYDEPANEDAIACFSNRNNITDLFAPGDLINSTWKEGYSQKSGTSMSAPHVAAAFALINQFKKLENSTALTPLEIQNAFNQTGKQINDSGESNLIFSRIDIYSAILYLDSVAPVVNLISPEDGFLDSSSNVSLICNATDYLQLSNLTFFVWNSSNYLINSTTFNATANNLISQLNLTNLENGTYTWNCQSSDAVSNKAFAISNYTFNVGPIKTVLNSPTNGLYTNINETNFTCSSYSQSSSNLTNVTFYLWNSTNLIYNETKNISGTLNQSIFNYTLINETEYSWNCLSVNNNSNSNFASLNYSINYDKTNPSLILISPSISYSLTGAQTINFLYNVSDSNIANCSLIINGLVNQTNNSITSNTNSFSKYFSQGTYNWQINCTDFAGNKNNTNLGIITISIASTSSPSSSSGGGGGKVIEITPEIYEITESEITNGVSKKLCSGDKLNFKIQEENHTLEIKEIKNDSINIELQSIIINFDLKVNETKKINLWEDNFYDLFIKLNSISENKVNLTIQKIYEEIPSRKLHNETNQLINSTNNINVNNNSRFQKFNSFMNLFILISFILIIEYLIIRKFNSKNKKSKSLKVGKQTKV